MDVESIGRLLRRLVALATALWLGTAGAQAPAEPALRLSIVGGLAGVNQFTRHEEPFWTHELSRLTAGRASAEIVPFDRAGIRAQEMLRLVQLGAVPFGTVLLNISSLQDPEFAAPDLAGLNPDIASLKRNIAAFRPYLRSGPCASATAPSCWRSTPIRRRSSSAPAR